jgi:hypothetical protein
LPAFRFSSDTPGRGRLVDHEVILMAVVQTCDPILGNPIPVVNLDFETGGEQRGGGVHAAA